MKNLLIVYPYLPCINKRNLKNIKKKYKIHMKTKKYVHIVSFFNEFVNKLVKKDKEERGYICKGLKI